MPGSKRQIASTEPAGVTESEIVRTGVPAAQVEATLLQPGVSGTASVVAVWRLITLMVSVWPAVTVYAPGLVVTGVVVPTCPETKVKPEGTVSFTVQLPPGTLAMVVVPLTYVVPVSVVVPQVTVKVMPARLAPATGLLLASTTCLVIVTAPVTDWRLLKSTVRFWAGPTWKVGVIVASAPSTDAETSVKPAGTVSVTV